MEDEKIAHAATLLGTAHRIVALTGAGFSRPSGIPDFRSGTGLWSTFNPQEVASLRGFRHHPQRFYDWFRPLLTPILQAAPNPAHYALAALEQSRRLSAVITQNIDGLHQRAGSREVFELHGHMRSATCLECEHQVPTINMLPLIQRGGVPRCSCGGLLKPDVVLFGEDLPRGIFWLARQAIEQSDTLIVAGTSLEVYPVCDLPVEAQRRGARLIMINLSPTHLDTQADVVLHADVAKVLPAIVARVI
ncbi:MAG TPA: NAD-dependent deacylase [Roseiflexaceae bacterium]|nr:NAD-dependent deacylase [Roseiflexaceae bacterium]HMP39824.1 NAD-dependent deacylase [Roseiflexaceae bacterium]